MDKNKFDTSLVVLFPVNKDGEAIPAASETEKKKQIRRFVKVDGERREVPVSGVLIERWKAEYVTQSPQYFYPLDHEDLTLQALIPSDEEYRKRLGAVTYRPKFSFRVPSSNEIMAAIAPVDEARISKFIAAEPFYANVMEEFGVAIRAAIRTRPDVDLHALFEGFASVMPGYKEYASGKNSKQELVTS